MADKNRPVKKVSAHGITASVWENQGKGDTTFYTVQLQRSYKDADDQWKNTDTLRLNDVPAAVAVLQKAYNELVIRDVA
jgi:hypothetical protein